MKRYWLAMFLGLAVGFTGCRTTGKTLKSQGAALNRMGPQAGDFSGLGEVSKTEKGIKLTLGGDLLFKVAHTHLSQGGIQTIDKLAALLVKHPAYLANIAVYTDNSGSDKGNLRITKKRAKAIREELVKQGVTAANLTAVGKGSADPVVANDTPDHQTLNRRVELEMVRP